MFTPRSLFITSLSNLSFFTFLSAFIFTTLLSTIPSAVLADQLTEVSYVVQPGDTPAQIAKQFGVTAENILERNNIRDATKLRAWETITVAATSANRREDSTAKNKWNDEDSDSYSLHPYQVLPGDTLSALALRFSVPQSAIMAANNITNPHRLRAWNSIKIPLHKNVSSEIINQLAPTTELGSYKENPLSYQNYVIQRGDRLGLLAEKFAVSQLELVVANKLSDPNILIAGRSLQIPAGGVFVKATGASKIQIAAVDQKPVSAVTKPTTPRQVTSRAPSEKTSRISEPAQAKTVTPPAKTPVPQIVVAKQEDTAPVPSPKPDPSLMKKVIDSPTPGKVIENSDAPQALAAAQTKTLDTPPAIDQMPPTKVSTAVAADQSSLKTTPPELRAEALELHLRLAKELHREKNWTGAIREFEKALRLDSENPDTHNLLGLAYFGNGEKNKAVAELKEAIRLNPDFAPAHYNLGTIYISLQQYPAAVSSLQNAVRLNPELSSAYINLAHALQVSGNNREALASYKEFLRIERSNQATQSKVLEVERIVRELEASTEPVAQPRAM